MPRICLVFALLIVSFACSMQKKDFGNFDFKAWKSDRGGCDGKRIKQFAAIDAHKEQLLGLSENEVFDYLGRYDMELLDSRNQKAFIYFYEKGPHCETPKQSSKARSMVLRFNAVSLVKEVEFMQGMP